MAEVGLKAEVRQGRGKGVARKLRARGFVPGVVYGLKEDPIPVTVNHRDLAHTLGTGAGANVLIDLEVDGRTQLALPRQVERDPIRGTILHVDFLLINRHEAVAVDVPIHLDGEAPGVREGGMLEHHLYQLHLETTPANMPERIEVDISGLTVGGSIRVGDITPPEGATILTAEDELIVTCVIAQDLPTEPELEAAEPEIAGTEGEEAGGETAS